MNRAERDGHNAPLLPIATDILRMMSAAKPVAYDLTFKHMTTRWLQHDGEKADHRTQEES